MKRKQKLKERRRNEKSGKLKDNIVRKGEKRKIKEMIGKGQNGRGEVRKEEGSEGEQSRGCIKDFHTLNLHQLGQEIV